MYVMFSCSDGLFVFSVSLLYGVENRLSYAGGDKVAQASFAIVDRVIIYLPLIMKD